MAWYGLDSPQVPASDGAENGVVREARALRDLPGREDIAA